MVKGERPVADKRYSASIEIGLPFLSKPIAETEFSLYSRIYTVVLSPGRIENMAAGGQFPGFKIVNT